jgi:hypothetical protein
MRALDIAAYQARTGATREEAGRWADLYAAEASRRFGVDSAGLSPEQSAECERAADREISALPPEHRG